MKSIYDEKRLEPVRVPSATKVTVQDACLELDVEEADAICRRDEGLQVGSQKYLQGRALRILRLGLPPVYGVEHEGESPCLLLDFT